MFYLIPFSLSACETYNLTVKYGELEFITFNANETTFCKTINFEYSQRLSPHMYIQWDFPLSDGSHTAEKQHLQPNETQITQLTKFSDFLYDDSYNSSTISLQLQEPGEIRFQYVAFDSEPGQQTTILSLSKLALIVHAISHGKRTISITS